MKLQIVHLDIDKQMEYSDRSIQNICRNYTDFSNKVMRFLLKYRLWWIN